MDCVGIAPSLAKFQMQACEAVSARPHPDVLGLFPSFSCIFISFPEGFLVPPPSLLPPEQLSSILASRMWPACMPYTVASSSVMPAACICSTVMNHSRIHPCLCSPLSLSSPPRGHLRDKGLAQLFVPGSVSENANWGTNEASPVPQPPGTCTRHTRSPINVCVPRGSFCKDLGLSEL